ncbi:MAG TPA: response regulator [Phenylobacterium sp.]|nr:response regulator [Phenylobacterium sp.]
MLVRPRILVVEDDAGVRDLVRTRLVLAGFETHTARNGAEGVNRVLEVRPDAMVLDINMSEMDGFGVLRTLRDQNRLVPTLVLTARHAAEDVRLAISLGAKDYLTKPFSEQQLLARISRVLRPPAVQPAIAAQRAAAEIANVLSLG